MWCYFHHHDTLTKLKLLTTYSNVPIEVVGPDTPFSCRSQYGLGIKYNWELPTGTHSH